jgi:hypothetical protein
MVTAGLMLVQAIELLALASPFVVVVSMTEAFRKGLDGRHPGVI